MKLYTPGYRGLPIEGCKVFVDSSLFNSETTMVLTHILMRQFPPVQELEIIFQGQEYPKDIFEQNEMLKQIIEHYKVPIVVDDQQGRLTVYNND